MKKQKEVSNSIKITAMALGTVVFIVLVAVYLVMWFSPSQTVTATGEATISATPDIVGLYFIAETKADSMEEAKDKNAEIVENLKDSLVALGLDGNSVTTSNYNVGEYYEWKNNQRIFKGYKATHNLRIELSSDDTELIGDVIDAGINADAGLSYINFELSPGLQNEYKAQATLLASQDAKGKAENIAIGLGQRLGRIVSVSESNFGYYPWRAYSGVIDKVMEEDMILEAKSVATNIQPGEQDISSSVSVVYKLK